MGAGEPCWRNDVRVAATFGLSRGTRNDHVVRAALASMAYQSRDAMAAMDADTGIPLKALRAHGRAMASKLMAQFQSDMLGVPLMRPRVAETKAPGAVYLEGLVMDSGIAGRRSPR